MGKKKIISLKENVKENGYLKKKKKRLNSKSKDSVKKKIKINEIT